MSASKNKPTSDIYTIKIKGHLEDHWLDWFEGLTFIYESDGTTMLQGPLPDQAALHGVLEKIRDLNLKLISVDQDEPRSADLHEES